MIRIVIGVAFVGFIAYLLFVPPSVENDTASANASDNSETSGGAIPRNSQPNGAANNFNQPTVSPNYRRPSEMGETSGSSFDDEYRKLKAEGFQNRVKLLTEDLAKLEQSREAWIQLTEQLATNDSGRRMASNQHDLPAIKLTLEADVISQLEFSELQDEVKLVERHATMNGLVPPSNDMVLAVEKATSRIDSAQKAIDKSLGALSQFEKASAGLSPSEMTLDVAIQQLENQQLAVSQRKMAELEAANILKLEQQAEENNKRIFAETLEANQKKAESDIERIRKQKVADEILAKAAREKAILEAEFQRDLPSIKQHLGQLFVDGYTQPSSRGFVRKEEAGPMSLAGLTDYGVFRDPDGSDGGYARMLALMGKAFGNDRAQSDFYLGFMGAYPKDHEVAAIREPYRLLKKYQTLLVEHGFLQK